MAFIQRVLSLGFVPIIALLALQIFSPETFQSFHYVIQPYISGTALSHFFPALQLPRSETPIIMITHTHWSHLEKIAGIATGLAENGYPITLIVGRLYEDYVSNLHPDIKFSPMHGEEDKMSDEDIKIYMSLPPGSIEQELFIMKKVQVDGMENMHNSLQDEFKAFRDKFGDSKPLISLYDFSISGHLPILMGAPGIKPDSSIGICMAPLTMDSNDTFPFRTGKPPHQGPDAKKVHWEAYQKFYEDRMNKELNEYWWDKLKEMGVIRDNYPHILHAMATEPDHLLTMGIPEFEFTRSDARTDIRYFGALKKGAKHADEKVPSWWDDVQEAKRTGKKIIAVSQGTVETNPQDLVIPAMESLKDRDDVLVIASFVVMEPEDVPDLVVPENARVAKFVPYDLLLPLVDVLVSNGGYGAVQQALNQGIPMVVGGGGQDKETTNSIIEWSGVGINLGRRDPGAEKIGDAIKNILEDDKYKQKAKEMSKQFEKYDVGKIFDSMIQDVVRDWTKSRES